MALTYIHLSDIHFGQEKGADVYVHDDVKECLIADVTTLKVTEGIERMDGVIVTGDIAFSGKKEEYDSAAQWLDRLTQAIGCKKTDVIVVPGNHDVDRERITPLAKLTLDHLHERGIHELEHFLTDPKATEILYDKFNDYRTFAEGYDCPLHSDGGVAVTRQVEIAPGRDLRFVGLNSALLCTGKKTDESKLLIGGRQHVLPRRDGCELVVLCHHPLESLQDEDGELVARYIRSRARVHVFGHVHQPSVSIDTHVEGADLLTMSAGAVVPPDNDDGYKYTYNLFRFDWDAGTECLKVEIVPRSWDEEATRFDADTDQFEGDRFQSSLRCPNFKRRAVTEPVPAVIREYPTAATPAASGQPPTGGNAMGHNSDLLRLHFFRDLSAEQRILALVKVGLLSDNWTSDLTHTLERRLFDKALSSGLEDQLASEVGALRTGAATVEQSEK